MRFETKINAARLLKAIFLSAFFAFAALFSGVLAVPGVSLAAAVIDREDSVLELQVSQAVMVKLDRDAKSIFIANPTLADVQIRSPRMLYVFGNQPGTTTFYAVDKDDNVIFGAKVTITHDVAYLQDTIDKLLPEASVHVESVNGLIILTGFAKSPEEADLAQLIVQETMISRATNSTVTSQGVQNRVINRIQITTPNQVNLRVKMAEMSRDTLKNLGFNWDIRAISDSGASFFGFFQGADFVNRVLDEDGFETLGLRTFDRGTGNSSVFNNIGGRHDVNGILDALETEGFVSILAEPNITAVSGETASFLAGGEFPVPVPQNSTSNVLTVEFKSFGVSLDFTPTILSENKIILNVAPEVSQLSTAGAVTINDITIPALTSRRAHTVVELASGQSFAIAGLLQSNISQEADKYPWLGDIPILGTLFRSDSFRRQETELVIIVTPYIVRPVNGQKLMTPTDINHLPEDAGRYIKGRRDLTGSGGLKVDK